MSFNVVRQEGQKPGERHSFSFSSADGKYFMIGGTVRNVTYPNVSVFENGVWTERPAEQNAPIRWGHSAVVKDDHLIIIFGGITIGGVSNETWIYNTNTNQWVNQPVSGAVPIARSNHTATLVGNNMYIIGGENVANVTDDVHVLNTDTWEWRRIEAIGQIPQPKKRHTTLLVNDSLYVFGGWCFGVSQHLNDLDILKLSNHEWKHIDQFGPVPSPRAGHVARLRGNFLFVWGGYGPSNQASEWNEVFYFDTTDEQVTWRKKKPMGRGQPPQTSDMGSAISDEGHIYIVYGLTDTKKQTCSSEIYTLDVSRVY